MLAPFLVTRSFGFANSIISSLPFSSNVKNFFPIRCFEIKFLKVLPQLRGGIPLNMFVSRTTTLSYISPETLFFTFSLIEYLTSPLSTPSAVLFFCSFVITSSLFALMLSAALLNISASLSSASTSLTNVLAASLVVWVSIKFLILPARFLIAFASLSKMLSSAFATCSAFFIALSSPAIAIIELHTISSRQSSLVLTLSL